MGFELRNEIEIGIVERMNPRDVASSIDSLKELGHGFIGIEIDQLLRLYNTLKRDVQEGYWNEESMAYCGILFEAWENEASYHALISEGFTEKEIRGFDESYRLQKFEDYLDNDRGLSKELRMIKLLRGDITRGMDPCQLLRYEDL